MIDNKNFNSETDNNENINSENEKKRLENEHNLQEESSNTEEEKQLDSTETESSEQAASLKEQSDTAGPKEPEKKLTQSETQSDLIMDTSPEDDDEGDEDEYGEDSPTDTTNTAEETTDYTEKNRDELLKSLEALIAAYPEKNINQDLKLIKQSFTKRTAEHKAELLQKREEERQALREQGEDDTLQDELPEDLYPNKLEQMLSKYKEKQVEYKQKLQAQRLQNLDKKKKIIQDIEALINKPEAFQKTFNEFKAFQKEWEQTGAVPKQDNREIWSEYNRVIENFYNYVKINKELRDLDLQKNTEIKEQLCIEAEKLQEMTDIMAAQSKLQKLHDRWRETGPVHDSLKEELWERFKKPTKVVNDKHQERLKAIKEQQEKNLESKTYLCEKAEEALEKEYNTNAEWKKASALVQKYQKLWNSIGYVPKPHNQVIYERFSTACDNFFDRMRKHFEKVNKSRQDNLDKKQALLDKAIERSESSDWAKDTKFFKEIQEEWKLIGPVPRRQSDKIWKQFRAACNTFFNRKREHFNKRRDEEANNLQLKKQLIDEITNYTPTENDTDIEKVKEFQARWQEIGFVPIKEKDAIINEYNRATDRLFDKLNLDKSQKVSIKFDKKIQALENADDDRVWAEIGKLRAKIDEREKEISLWKNNLGFFANNKGSEEMRKEYEKRIKRAEKQVAEYKVMIEQLRNI